MRAGARAPLVLILGSMLAVASPALAPAAFADSNTGTAPHRVTTSKHATLKRQGHARHASAGLQCVPFARAESGIVIKGNAANWWDAAAGVYARGSRPEQGAVLNFRPTGGMRLGHVAVVTNVLSSREIEIDHANWSRFGATRGNVSLATHVIDVSPNNDWTAVRVELGHTGGFGSVYPTYGFIYDRPDTGTRIATTLATLHPTGERPALAADEVAEAPAPPVSPAAAALPIDAPSHSLR
jgi:surface antigen